MRKPIALAIGLVVFSIGGSLGAAPLVSTGPERAKECLHVNQHVYEVCYAYVVNDSAGALWWYYKYAHSPNPARALAARNRLESRYTGQARRLVEGRVAAKWPKKSETEVALPRITIVSVVSDLVNNQAILVTSETWRVTNKAGKIIYSETMRHHIRVQRVQGLILHKWVVTLIN